MDSTCIPGEIQCTQEVVESLQGSHFEFRFVLLEIIAFIYKQIKLCLLCFYRCRGQIKVKGKGDMITYFLNDHIAQNQYNNGIRDSRALREFFFNLTEHA